ncbi:kinase-like protein [Paxillus ammoniavirescens]|nr:kinase-like protein [Paxillus ammoniavirescens]
MSRALRRLDYLGQKKGTVRVSKRWLRRYLGCDLMTGETLRKVAVKAVRAQRNDTQYLATQEKMLRRELKVWDRLQHDNIVQLLGVVSVFGPLSSMVCPGFSNGSLSSYLSNHEAMVLSGRQGLLLNIASGLCYLHSQGVVRGDLHSGNVLVDENGRACLTDFGLSVIIKDFPGTSYLKSGVCGTLRYADPELVRQVHADGKVVHPTESSDVLTGKQPYEGIKEFVLPTIILNGDRPLLLVNREQISPKHESFIQRCWNPEESTCPSAEDIVKLLQEIPV